MTFFDWVGFFMNPYNILMFGFAGGALALFLSAGVMFLVDANRKIAKRIVAVVTVLAVLLIQLACWGLVFWYNTPLGPALELE